MNEVCKIRTFFIFIIFFLFYITIIINLFFIQIINNKYYTDLAYNQHNITVTTIPRRALILDRNDNPIALNRDSYSAFILPNKIEQPKELNSFLKKYFPDSLKKLETNKFFIYLKRRITDEEIKLIESSNLKDIKILKEPSRFYPYEYLGTIVGITDIDNNGLFGIEKEYNKQLSGSPTTFILEKDARSGHFYFKRKTKLPGSESNSIKLTIDKDLQFLVYEELKETVNKFQAKEGSAIIINPDNGHIISMLSLPFFNPADTSKIDIELTKNITITNTYELGSVMKVFVAIAALEEGLVTPTELIDCENKKVTKIDGLSFSTWKAHGMLTFAEIIEKSNNIGIVKVAKKVGKKLYDHYLRFGFGQKTGISLCGEQKGYVSHPKNWSKRSIISLAFGYEITATLLQLARAFCIIANEGYDITPTIIFDNNNSKKEKLLYSKTTMQIIKSILENTVTRGTAKKAYIDGYTIMGKTGTANIAIDGKYSKIKNIYTFAGIVQKNNYKRVIVVHIKESSNPDLLASFKVAPLFEKVAQKMLIHDKMI